MRTTKHTEPSPVLKAEQSKLRFFAQKTITCASDFYGWRRYDKNGQGSLSFLTLGAVQQAALEFGDGALDNLGYAYKDINNDWRITK